MLQVIAKIQQKIPRLSLSQFNLVLALWLGVVLNLAFYQQIQQLTPYTGLKAGLFLAATVLVVVALYNVLMQLLQWRWNSKLLASVLLIIGGLSAYFVNSLGVTITSDQVQNMMQTDVKEVQDLISPQFFIWVFGLVILPVLLIWLLPLHKEALSTVVAKKGLHIVLSLILLGALLFVYFVDYAAIFREHRDLKGMLSPQNSIASTFSYYHKKAPKQNLPLLNYGEDAHMVENVSAKSLPKLMVLVVGETARAESFSLNGYAKNTNPELSQQNIINFSQVSSCGTATAVSVPCMFSGMPRTEYDEQLASHREGLLDIAQRAGYKVTWLDNNSGCKGTCTRVEKYEFPEALKKKWCDADGECHDEILVDGLKVYLASIPKADPTPRLIVLHQMGSHGPAYFKRSTAAFQKFKPTCNSNAIQGCSSIELINSYDNSIIYTDHVLSELINTLKVTDHYQTGLWYLSDHGESTGEHGLYLHGSPYAIAPSQQTHVPMLMWFSPAWQKNNSAQYTCLMAQKSQKLSQDNLFPSLLSLLDVQTQVIDEKNNMLQQCTSVQRRT
ncbi:MULTISPECIES: phosphoethanolamine transferase [unclassified Acinetobacter]|uniref:phosphoethanolamine transferase n=1 Tax=unclassified Acinetobacter TaxID=196816 RepID=UPI0015D2BD7F|nr:MULTISPECIES: phosphoethanolamine--lipid A transferase [unclassified Acinetobacter]